MILEYIMEEQVKGFRVEDRPRRLIKKSRETGRDYLPCRVRRIRKCFSPATCTSLHGVNYKVINVRLVPHAGMLIA